MLPGTSARSSSSRVLLREHPASPSPHIQRTCCVCRALHLQAIGIGSHLRGPPKQSAPGWTRSLPQSFAIYKMGLAYNEKHNLPPGHITLRGVLECGPKNDPITQKVFLHCGIIYQRTNIEISHRFKMKFPEITR